MSEPSDTNENAPGTFPTSTGVCRVTDDRIELERTGWKGRVASLFVGDSISRAVVWYLVAGLGLVAWGLYDLLVVGTYLGWLPLTFGAVALVNVGLSRDASAATEISRDAIDRIVPEPPVPLLRRGHFMVHFRDDGERRRRVIMMPGLFGGGRDAYREASELFDAEGLLEDPSE